MSTDPHPGHDPAQGDPPPLDLDLALDEARRIARDAGQLLLEGRARGFSVQHKGVVDLVTEYDHRSEALVVEALNRAFPRCQVIGEEGHDTRGDGSDGAQGLWYVDPLDGTTNFAHGLPFYAVSIGLVREGELAVGVVLAPEMGWEFYARAGGGAYLNERPLAVSQAQSVQQALLATGFPYNRAEIPDNNLAELSTVLCRCQGIRRVGAAALDCAMVAAGFLDGYWEHHLHPWDICAGALLVREAGGRVTDLSGGDFDVTGAQIVATNGRVHDELVSLLQRARATVG